MTELSGASRPSIGDYLIRRIRETGCRHVFGVPGDYVLNFYAMLDRSPLRVINTCDEQGAGFAADAYARMQGFGVVCATYMVGGLKLLNTTAQAYAERSPVLVIAGAPGYRERERHPLLHHRDPATAFREIDRVIAEIVRTKRPGCIELPRDMVDMVPVGDLPSPVPVAAARDGRPADEVVERVAAVLDGAERPVIVAGVEVARFGLEPAVRELAARTGIPIVATFLGKSAVDETDPRYLGVYSGAVGDEAVREYVESSDCLLLLGVLLTDVNLGGNTAVLDPERMISLSAGGCSIGREACPVPGLELLPALERREQLAAGTASANVGPHAEQFEPQRARVAAELAFEHPCQHVAGEAGVVGGGQLHVQRRFAHGGGEPAFDVAAPGPRGDRRIDRNDIRQVGRLQCADRDRRVNGNAHESYSSAWRLQAVA